MAFPATNYNRETVRLSFSGTAIDFTNGLKAALFNTNITGTFDFSAAMAYGSAPWNANEASGTGYSPGGVALTSVTSSISGSTIVIAAANPTWTITGSFATDLAGVLVYDDTAATKYALAAISFLGNYNVSNGLFTVDWSDTPIAGSIFTIA